MMVYLRQKQTVLLAMRREARNRLNCGVLIYFFLLIGVPVTRRRCDRITR